MSEQIQQFFEAYAARTNRALGDDPVVDVDGVTGSFADSFIEASPNGVACGKNDDQFREVIPKGMEMYRSIGTKSMRILSLDIIPLDDYHTQVKVHWEAFYEKKDGNTLTIDFYVIYFLQTLNGPPKIFAYITGDEQKVYQDYGLVPG